MSASMTYYSYHLSVNSFYIIDLISTVDLSVYISISVSLCLLQAEFLNKISRFMKAREKTEQEVEPVKVM